MLQVGLKSGTYKGIPTFLLHLIESTGHPVSQRGASSGLVLELPDPASGPGPAAVFAVPAAVPAEVFAVDPVVLAEVFAVGLADPAGASAGLVLADLARPSFSATKPHSDFFAAVLVVLAGASAVGLAAGPVASLYHTQASSQHRNLQDTPAPRLHQPKLATRLPLPFFTP